MGGENIERIVVSKGELELCRKIADRSGHETEENGGGCAEERIFQLALHYQIPGKRLREPTKPEAGVIATKPETAPEQKPTADHLRSKR